MRSAYVRGNTLKFYEWLAASDSSKVPQGPPIWICGDCHVGNLGPLADIDGEIDIEIRDLDQTVIGNPAHDLIRLGLSLATAARGSDLPGVTTAKMIEQMIEGYEEALADKDPDLRSRRPECVRVVMRQAVERTWDHLAKERLEDTNPTIPLGKRFWPAGDPVYDLEAISLSEIWGVQQIYKLSPGPYTTVAEPAPQAAAPLIYNNFPVSDQSLFETALLQSCDALDGVADGVIDNLPACRATFDPATATYSSGGTVTHCSAPERRTQPASRRHRSER
ncbi:MAG TPA: DUF2252 family protein [Stellaceae bacterium]|nr:DUF2252 family protein [Stellaceae bacterium]